MARFPHRPVGAARTQPAPVRTRLHVEQLEARNLLSAQSITSLVASPQLTATPLVTNAFPAGLTPAQVRHAYGFDQISFNQGQVAANGAGQTIALITAYDDPSIYSDLQVFDRTFGLADPPSFAKAWPSGTPPVAPSPSWHLETSLDVEWAHAMAPGANILLVEAPDSSMGSLLNAVYYARTQPGVVAVSMSWGVSEFSIEGYFDGYFTTPAGHIGGSGLAGGITFVGSSGDSSALTGGTWPSVSTNVLAVGGTRLTTDAFGNYLGESGWTNGGGAISQFEARPGYQNGSQTTANRTSPDVAYNADPFSGFAIYDSNDFNGQNGWLEVGGTSAGAPQWAALVAIADQGRALLGKGSLDGASQTLPALYQAPGAFHDITTGNNGFAAHAGYDLVTGLGTPYANRVVNLLATGNLNTAASNLPSTPSAPTQPTAPSAPTAPTQPTAPSAPSAPTKPTAPGAPTSPSTPSKPTHSRHQSPFSNAGAFALVAGDASEAPTEPDSGAIAAAGAFFEWTGLPGNELLTPPAHEPLAPPAPAASRPNSHDAYFSHLESAFGNFGLARDLLAAHAVAGPHANDAADAPAPYLLEPTGTKEALETLV